MQIHVIDLGFQGTAGLIASFLVESDDGLILIEPGPESTRAKLLEGIRALGLSPDEVRSVFITHAHLDHAGSGGWWAQAGARLYVHPRASRHLIDPTQLVESARQVFGDTFDSLWGEMLPAPETMVQALEDGETVTIGGVTVEAIDTPGHAFHHHAFAIGDVAFAGDAAGVRLDGTDYLSVATPPPAFHLESCLNSIDRLAGRQFDRIYLTHFGGIDTVDEYLSRYRSAVIGAADLIQSLAAGGDDAESIRVAYQAFQMEQAYQAGLPRDRWDDYQVINSTDMCADGLRMYWERESTP
jgi:glyoxylase-like metal-dependent hydrolase (beta-lactamase superfamily II)